MKSALSPVLSLETSCSAATCFLIELTSTHLPRQMAPFPCLCLARIYKHISACPAWDMDGCIQVLRLWMSISARGPNSLTELGRSVPLHYWTFSFHLHDFFPIKILCSRSFVFLTCLQNSSHIFQGPLNKAIWGNWKGFFNLSFIFDHTGLCNLIINPTPRWQWDEEHRASWGQLELQVWEGEVCGRGRFHRLLGNPTGRSRVQTMKTNFLSYTSEMPTSFLLLILIVQK